MVRVRVGLGGESIGGPRVDRIGRETEGEYCRLSASKFMYNKPTHGWLHFYLRQKRNEWFTFATHARMSRGGRAPRSRAALHISAKQCAHTVGGTACAHRSTAIWPCDPRR